jgi:hypothetical protein
MRQGRGGNAENQELEAEIRMNWRQFFIASIVFVSTVSSGLASPDASAQTPAPLTGTTEWSFGPSIGFSPKENVWASVGYNLTGFEDRDFKAAEYTRNVLYIKLRLKFDEDSLDWMLDQTAPKVR